MDNRAALIETLQQFNKDAIQVWPAIVKSVQGTNCTVDILNTDLVDIDEVNLRADDEATEGVLLVPRVGSYVYVSAVENALDNLFVSQFSEVDSVQIKIGPLSLTANKDQVLISIGNTTLTIDKDQVHAVRDQCELTLTDKAILKQGQTSVQLANNKVSITNGSLSLKGLFDTLTSLLQTFQVLCAGPGSPSAPFPATITQVQQLSTQVAQLLQ